MIYKKSLTIPAKTQLPTTETTELGVSAGTVKQVFLTFPDGCAGLVGFRVRYRERILWPSNPDQWFISYGYTFEFLENLEIDDEPYAFTLEGYNDDCAYPHTITLRLTILRESPDLLSQLLLGRPTLST